MKKNISFIILVMISMMIFAGCDNKKLDETEIYYSTMSNPAEFYIRLEADGDYINGAGLSGKYELEDEKITFKESNGGVTEGYLVNDGKYIFYNAFDGYGDRIPEADKFDITCFDGARTSLIFKEDGKMEKYIYEENYMDYHFGGTYERKGNLIVCTYNSSEGTPYTQMYGIYDGVLYEAFSSVREDFSEKDLASVDQLGFEDNGEPVSILAVVMIGIVLAIIFAIIMFFLFALGKNNKKKASKGRKNK